MKGMRQSREKQCTCQDCIDGSHDRFIYKDKRGKSTFTGFLVEGKTGNIVWVGKDEKANKRYIDKDNNTDTQFFLMEMRQYD